MTRTLDEQRDALTRPERAAAVPERAAKARGQRRPSRRERRAAAAAAAPKAAVIDVEIEPGDPLLPFLESAPGPLDIDALPSFSPAVARMRAQEVRTVVPLVTSGELVGVLALGPRLSERTYTRTDRRLLDSLARFAAPALRLGQLLREQEAEARERERIEQELHVAQLIQQQFLPSDLPELGGWHLAAFYRPARTVGGDFYDVIELGDGRVMVVVGDVTDKGVPAALVMASTHALLRGAAQVTDSPAEVLRRVNELLVPQIPLNMFVTCLVMVLDLATGATRLANAGHNLPYIRRGGRAVQVDARGMPLGLLPGSRYTEVDAVIAPDEVVLLYSDGITEQHDAAGEMFGFGRTGDLVARAVSGDGLVDDAVEALLAFSGDVEQEDDITLVALHRGGRALTTDTVSFAIPSAIGNEREVMDRVAAIVGDALPPERLEALKTAVSETAMNAIEHGNRGRPEVDVDVTVRCSPDTVTVDVVDYGRGRHGVQVDPDIDLKLAGEQSPRGWGLFLVERLTDRVEELADGDRHVVRLTMRTTLTEGDR